MFQIVCWERWGGLFIKEGKSVRATPYYKLGFCDCLAYKPYHPLYLEILVI
jgi:hypothetical protein